MAFLVHLNYSGFRLEHRQSPNVDSGALINGRSPTIPQAPSTPESSSGLDQCGGAGLVSEL